VGAAPHATEAATNLDTVRALQRPVHCGCERQPRGAAHVRTDFEQITSGASEARCDRARFGSVGLRHDELVALHTGMRGRNQQAADRLELAGETELAVKLARGLARLPARRHPHLP